MRHCLKCGREVDEGIAFCASCVSVMKQCPVEPGTPVVLPNRRRAVSEEAPRKAAPAPEEVIRRLRSAASVLAVLLALVTVMLGISIGYMLHLKEELAKPAKGQNYTVTESTAGSTEETVRSE